MTAARSALQLKLAAQERQASALRKQCASLEKAKAEVVAEMVTAAEETGPPWEETVKAIEEKFWEVVGVNDESAPATEAS